MDKVFNIISENHFNSNPEQWHCAECRTYDRLNGSYITFVEEEDFLEKLTDRVFKLGKLLKGDNKAEAHAIAKELTELGQQVANAAAYGREELDQILNPKK